MTLSIIHKNHKTRAQKSIGSVASWENRAFTQDFPVSSLRHWNYISFLAQEVLSGKKKWALLEWRRRIDLHRFSLLSFKSGTKGWGAYLAYQSRCWPPGFPSIPTCYKAWLAYLVPYSKGWTALPYIIQPFSYWVFLYLRPPSFCIWFHSFPSPFSSLSSHGLAQGRVLSGPSQMSLPTFSLLPIITFSSSIPRRSHVRSLPFHLFISLTTLLRIFTQQVHLKDPCRGRVSKMAQWIKVCATKFEDLSPTG